MFRCEKCLNDYTKEFRSCPMCGGQIQIVETIEDIAPLFNEMDLQLAFDPNQYQYKVITQKDRFFSSKFNPALIERALNEYAQEGWTLKTAVSADFGSVGMSRNELIIFLEKAPNGQVDS